MLLFEVQYIKFYFLMDHAFGVKSLPNFSPQDIFL